MRIVFMGTPDFAVCSLEELLKSPHQVGLVITQPDKAKDRGKKVLPPPVKERAEAAGIKVLQPIKIRDDEEVFRELEEYAPDIIVVVAYGQIIPKKILELPRYGCINVHGSLLPKLRGAAPIQMAIVSGEKETGITIMQMGEGLDTGDMLTKDRVEIGNMNFRELHDCLAQMGGRLLVKTLELIEKGEVVPEPQKDEEATYAGLIRKQDGAIDFNRTAQEVERLIRGFDPWPGAFCTYKDKVMKLWKAQAVSTDKEEKPGTITSVDHKGVIVTCGTDSLLVTEIQMPGKKRVTVEEYLKGNKIEKGEVLNNVLL